MNAQTDFDIGPLTWVKSEIDLALERADKALQELAASAGRSTTTISARSDSVVPTCTRCRARLTIVGLDGVTQFTEALEALLEAVETPGAAVPTQLRIELSLRRAMASASSLPR
jgi:chemosensory pili system protein ChpA (sensor histidine kinase/response regulator)